MVQARQTPIAGEAWACRKEPTQAPPSDCGAVVAELEGQIPGLEFSCAYYSGIPPLAGHKTSEHDFALKYPFVEKSKEPGTLKKLCRRDAVESSFWRVRMIYSGFRRSDRPPLPVARKPTDWTGLSATSRLRGDSCARDGGRLVLVGLRVTRLGARGTFWFVFGCEKAAYKPCSLRCRLGAVRNVTGWVGSRRPGLEGFQISPTCSPWPDPTRDRSVLTRENPWSSNVGAGCTNNSSVMHDRRNGHGST